MPPCTCLVVGHWRTSWMAYIWIPVWLHSCAASTQTVTDGSFCSRGLLPEPWGALPVNVASSLLSYLRRGGAEGCTFWIRVGVPSIQSLSWIHPEPMSYLNRLNSIAFVLKIPGGMECVPGTRRDPGDAPVSRITRELHWFQLDRELRMKAKSTFLLS